MPAILARGRPGRTNRRGPARLPPGRVRRNLPSRTLRTHRKRGCRRRWPIGGTALPGADSSKSWSVALAAIRSARAAVKLMPMRSWTPGEQAPGSEANKDSTSGPSRRPVAPARPEPPGLVVQLPLPAQLLQLGLVLEVEERRRRPPERAGRRTELVDERGHRGLGLGVAHWPEPCSQVMIEQPQQQQRFVGSALAGPGPAARLRLALKQA